MAGVGFRWNGAHASVASLLWSALLVSCTPAPRRAGPTLVEPPRPPEEAAKQIALPADGEYRDVTILGEPVASLQITDSGRRVLVDVDGEEPTSFEQEFRRRGQIAGQLDQRRIDTDGDGDFEDELPLLGIWRLDGEGNIRR